MVQGTHKWETKGWEGSVYMTLVAAPVILYLGLSNAPETDSEVFARYFCPRNECVIRR